MSGMTAYAPWIAWAVVPSLATDWTQKILISSNILRRPTTREDAIRQSARLRACLVGGYLIYLFWTSIASHEPSAYALLGVDIDCGGEQIKKAFRKLAMVYHPDKVGPQGERFFIALRRSHDVLSDPVKRFAYDRFGISVLDWKDALSYREHMVTGLRETFAFWVVNPVIFAFISWLHKDVSPFSLWHLTLLFALFSTELYIITTPDRPTLQQLLLPKHTTRDVVLLIHQTYTSLVMAARQVFPLLSSVGGGEAASDPRNLKEAQAVIERMATQIEQLQGVSQGMTLGSHQALGRSLQPFQSAAISTARTLPEAAEAASQRGQSKDSPMSNLQDTYVHLISERLTLDAMRHREDFQKMQKSISEAPIQGVGGQGTTSSSNTSQSAANAASGTSEAGTKEATPVG